MTFTVIYTDSTKAEYEADSWEAFIKIADLENCVGVLVKEN